MFWVLIIIALLLTLILAELLWLDHLFRKGFALPILAWIRKRQRDRELGDDDSSKASRRSSAGSSKSRGASAGKTTWTPSSSPPDASSHAHRPPHFAFHSSDRGPSVRTPPQCVRLITFE